MQTINLKGRVGDDGVLRLEVPEQARNQVLEVVVIAQPTGPDVPRDELGWPIGFFERTQGALADDPIERPPQPYVTE